MAKFLLVAHEPLASALLVVARHVYPDSLGQIEAVDVGPQEDLLSAQARIKAALENLNQLPGPPSEPPHDVLVLADVFGATPCTAAAAACEGMPARVVAGLSVPMLWRVLAYADKPLDDLVERALVGATQGALHATTSRRQNQNTLPLNHDHVNHHHQQ